MVKHQRFIEYTRVMFALVIGQIIFGFCQAATQLSYKIIDQYPHDKASFTQGLEIHNNSLIETSGLYGKSYLRRVSYGSGEVLAHMPIGGDYFAEGITQVDSKLYMLTWKARKVFVYDVNSFEPIGTFSYEGEGWGIAYDGTHLITSDGSSKLRFMQPHDLKQSREPVNVRLNGKPVNYLNELEYMRGYVLANALGRDRIYLINPGNGEVLYWIDLRPIRRLVNTNYRNVANGIAYESSSDSILITGKNWPSLVKIKIAQIPSLL